MKNFENKFGSLKTSITFAALFDDEKTSSKKVWKNKKKSCKFKNNNYFCSPFEKEKFLKIFVKRFAGLKIKINFAALLKNK